MCTEGHIYLVISVLLGERQYAKEEPYEVKPVSLSPRTLFSFSLLLRQCHIL